MSFQAFDPPPIPTRIKEADENNASNTSLGKKYVPCPCSSVLDFWKVKFEELSSTNWVFSLFQTWFLLPVQPAKIKFEKD